MQFICCRTDKNLNGCRSHVNLFHCVLTDTRYSKIGQSSLIMKPFFLKETAQTSVSLWQEQFKLSFLRQARGQSMVVCLLWWDTFFKFLPSSTLKRKAYLLPSWCPHYYLAIPPTSDRTRPHSQGASSEKPNVAFLIQYLWWWIHRGLLHIKPNNSQHVKPSQKPLPLS